MNNEVNQYLSFLSQTLGVNTILIDDAKNASTMKNDTYKYSIYVENLSTYSPEEKTLLDKMITALKFNSSDYRVFDFKDKNSVSLSDLNLKIILKDSPNETGETYSPRMLLKQPELKRKAWDDLKLTFQIK